MPVLVLAAVAFVVLAVWLSRVGEIFLVSVRDGRTLLVRGRAPQSLLNDIHDIVSRPPARRATIRAVRAGGGARLTVSGDVDEGRVQRLRNAFALQPISRLQSAPPPDDRTIGQIAGIVWLAWLVRGNRR